MKIRTRKRYWFTYIPLVTIFTCGIGLIFMPLAWLFDKSMAQAAYAREDEELPPAWYDGISKWEFERVIE